MVWNFTRRIVQKETSVLNTIVSDSMEKVSTTSNPLLCKNMVVIRDTKDCNIKGGTQMCVAQGVLESIKDPDVMKEFKKEVHEKVEKEFNHVVSTNLRGIMKHPSVKTKDVIAAALSFKSMEITTTFTKHVSTTITNNTTKKLATRCNQAIHAANKATIDGTICETKEHMDHVSNLGQQESGINGLASCALGEGDWESNRPTPVENEIVEAFTDLSRDWVPKGVEPLQSACYSLLLSSILLVIGWSASAHKSKYSIPLKVLTLIMVAITLYVWPGRLSLIHGGSPYSSPITTKTVGGQWICNKEAMRKIILSPLGRVLYDSRTDTQSFSSYGQCGILGGHCDAPGLSDHINDWKDINKACSALAPAVITSCKASDVFSSVISNVNVPSCKRCKGKVGLFDSTVDCADVKDVSTKIYGGFGFATNSDGSTASFSCPPGDESCIPDRVRYTSLAPGECLSGEYHDQKRVVVGIMKDCAKVKEMAKNPSDEIGTMCPPKPSDYLLCSDDGKCYYSFKDPARKKYCQNDFTDCKDQSYLKDKFYADILEAKCDIAIDQSKEHAGLLNMVLPIYVLLFVFIVLMFGYRWTMNGRPQPVPTPIYVLSMLLVIPVLVCLLPPFGIVQVVNQRGIYTGGGLPFDGEGNSFDPVMTMVPIGLLLIATIALVPFVYASGHLNEVVEKKVVGGKK